MSSVQIDGFQERLNPLEAIEKISLERDWAFERTNEDEMAMELQGRWSDHRFYFVWHPEASALEISCMMDIKLKKGELPDEVAQLIVGLNSKLWLGHFDVARQEGLVMIRHTHLVREKSTKLADLMGDMIQGIAEEVERFYPAFQFVIWGGKTADEAMEVSMFETAGNA